MQPGQQKITQFDEVTSTQSGDIIPIVRGGQNKRISVENFTGVLPEGWQTPAEEWTFSSFGSGIGVITVPEGNINRYPNGTRVWFKQGTPTPTNRYGVIIASTTTTITVFMVGGTTLQNLAIQQPAVSQEAAPRTPENVDFTTSNQLLNSSGQSYAIIGKVMMIWGENNFSSSGTTVTFIRAFASPPKVNVTLRDVNDHGGRVSRAVSTTQFTGRQQYTTTTLPMQWFAIGEAPS